MTYVIEVSKAAQKSLKKIPKDYQEKIAAAINGLETNPRPTGVKKLKGEDNQWRIRVGIYRVIYHIFDRILVVQVIDIAHRKDAYD